jgi:hypothetical protein
MRAQSQRGAHDGPVQDSRTGIDQKLTVPRCLYDASDTPCIDLLYDKICTITEKASCAGWVPVAASNLMPLANE